MRASPKLNTGYASGLCGPRRHTAEPSAVIEQARELPRNARSQGFRGTGLWFGVQWGFCADDGAVSWPGDDVEGSVDERDPFAHPEEPDAVGA